MGRACSTHGEKRNEYRILVRKPEGKRQLRRPRHKREGNVKIYSTEIEWSGFISLRIETSGGLL
jgi:hypothetical protein